MVSLSRLDNHRFPWINATKMLFQSQQWHFLFHKIIIECPWKKHSTAIWYKKNCISMSSWLLEHSAVTSTVRSQPICYIELKVPRIPVATQAGKKYGNNDQVHPIFDGGRWKLHWQYENPVKPISCFPYYKLVAVTSKYITSAATQWGIIILEITILQPVTHLASRQQQVKKQVVLLDQKTYSLTEPS